MKLLQNLRRDKKGFTLIEVVIVLAIAALILVIVFLAVAGAQRSQRDQASKNAAGRLVAQFTNYVSDNGNIATGGTAIPSQYLDKISDGRGKLPTNSAAAATMTTFTYRVGGTCTAGGSPAGGITDGGIGQTNKIAVAYYSESGNTSVCLTN
mgnify:CR=1 FL=1